MTELPAPGPRAALLHEDPVVHRRRWFLLGIMCLSLVMVVMSVAGLNVALPSLQRELGANSSALQWIVDSYGLVFAALLLPAGALGDRFGRKRALMLGLVIFTTGSIIGGLGTGSAQVIAGRIVTGIGAAFVMPATLSLLTTIFPPHERRKAIAMWAGFASAGGALGPIVSGALLEKFWWGSAFLVNVPIVALVLLAVAVFSPTSKDPEATPLDPIGAVLSLVGLGALVYGIIEGPEKGWTSSTVLIAYALAAVGLVGFMVWERRTKHPMLPLHLFKDRRMSVGSAVVTVAFFIMFGLFFLFTLYLQFVRGYSPLAAGLSTLPLAFALIAIAPRSATLSEKLGTGTVMASGFLLISAGFGVLAFIGDGTPYAVLALALVLLGAGMSLTAAPATGSIMSAVPPAKAGVGSAVNDTTREVGGALGIAVLGSIASAAYRSSVDFNGLSLPPQVREGATESIGAATGIAAQAGQAGAELAARAGAAFTDAFNVTSIVASLVALAAAGVVAVVFSRQTEDAAIAEGDRVEAERLGVGGLTGVLPASAWLDPRVERSRRVILAAALDLLAEVGCGGITMEAVAARAGVGKSTVYRHWPGKLELIEDAIRTLKPVVGPGSGGTVRSRVVTLLQAVATGLADSTWSSCLPAIIDAAERDPEVLAIHRRLAYERRQILVDLLAEGVTSGEISADLDLGLLAECLFGPLVVRRLLLHEPFDPAAVPALVEQVLTRP